MVSHILRGRCPYDDCERNIPFHPKIQKGQCGVCPDCFRMHEVVEVDEDNQKITLSALE